MKINMAWCDEVRPHEGKDKVEAVGEETLTVGNVTRTIDVCEDCLNFLRGMAAFLIDKGVEPETGDGAEKRPEVSPKPEPKQETKQDAQERPKKKAQRVRMADGPVMCVLPAPTDATSICGKRNRNRQVLSQHLRSQHNTTLRAMERKGVVFKAIEDWGKVAGDRGTAISDVGRQAGQSRVGLA